MQIFKLLTSATGAKGLAFFLSIFLARVLPLVATLLASYWGALTEWIVCLFSLSIVSVGAIFFQFGIDRDIVYLLPKASGTAGLVNKTYQRLMANQFIRCAIVVAAVLLVLLPLGKGGYVVALLMPIHSILITSGYIDKANNRLVGFAIKSDAILYIAFFLAFMLMLGELSDDYSRMVILIYLSVAIPLIVSAPTGKGLPKLIFSKSSWTGLARLFVIPRLGKRGQVRRMQFFVFGLVDVVRANLLHFFLPFMPLKFGGVLLVAYRIFALSNLVSLVQNLFLPQRYSSNAMRRDELTELFWKNIRLSMVFSFAIGAVLFAGTIVWIVMIEDAVDSSRMDAVILVVPVAVYFISKNCLASLKAFLNMVGRSSSLAVVSHLLGLLYLVCAYASLAFMQPQWLAIVGYVIFTLMAGLEPYLLLRRALAQGRISYAG